MPVKALQPRPLRMRQKENAYTTHDQNTLALCLVCCEEDDDGTTAALATLAAAVCISYRKVSPVKSRSTEGNGPVRFISPMTR